ncbi:MAG: serine/threonine protein kinase [Deltaproteobacteria bacterium]|nr:serine/threonine protein kinase [Deltaproteobacteria bacterium]
MTPCGACGEEHPGAAAVCPRTGHSIAAGGPCGSQIERYRIERWIGGGGSGAVYRATHTLLGHSVALKLLRPELSHDANAVQRFLREARSAAAVGSPHILRVLDFGVSAEGSPFLVMELLEGEDLGALLGREGRLSVSRAADIALQMLEGLGAAHAAGIVHRDVKPANVYLARSAPDTGRRPAEVVKLLDFGMGRATRESTTWATQAGSILGTPHYMAPEQARGGDADHRADLWSTAVVLYRMLAGELPFDGATREEIIVRISTERAPAIRSVAPHVPAALAAAIDRCLSPDPAGRIGSAAELASVLRPASKEGKRRSWRLAVAVALVGCVVGVGLVAGILFWARPAPDPLPSPAAPVPVAPSATTANAPPTPSPPARPAPSLRRRTQAEADALAALFRMNPAPVPTPTAPVTFSEPAVYGSLRVDEVRAALESVLQRMDRCRIARHERIRISVNADAEGGLHPMEFLGNLGNPEVTDCVARTFAEGARLPPSPQGGVLYVEAALLAR